MQLQTFDQAGQQVYDSGAVTEPELTWALRQDSGEAVKRGLYAYTLSIKEEGAEAARVRRGHFIVDRARERDGQTDRLWITSHNDSGVGTELTVARNDGVTVAGASAGVMGVTTNGTGVLGHAGPDGYAGDFQGKVRLRGNLIPAGRGSFDLGQDGLYWRFIYTAHIIQASDARLKKDVADLRYGLRELMQLRPVIHQPSPTSTKPAQ